MTTSARERLTRVALGLVLLAGVVAVTFGAGYRASDALLDGASAYVQKDHTVVRVNAESRDTDGGSSRLPRARSTPPTSPTASKTTKPSVTSGRSKAG